MESRKLVSLCIPTNGVVEWVFPVLDSIFNQNVNSELFEVVITDNGNNIEFKEKLKEYRSKYTNIVYAETTALPFLNEIESYKRASGQLIKFVNHRTMLVEGALEKLIAYVKNNVDKKPITYFANGVLKIDKSIHTYDSFDLFVRNLSYWSSWSTGMAIWKEDFDNIPEDTIYNELFPHTTVLFRERQRQSYVIDNTVIMDELPTGKIAKGRYDLFGAFAVEYPAIICDLLRDGSIKSETFLSVKKDNLEFISNLYLNYCVLKRSCSYDLSGLKNAMGIFYRNSELHRMAVRLFIKRAVGKVVNSVKNK